MVVVASEGAEQSAVVVGHKVLGNELDGLVVVFQREVEEAQFVAGLRTGHVEFVVGRLGIDGSGEEGVGTFKLVLLQGIATLEGPGVSFGGIEGEHGVHAGNAEQRVAPLEGYLCLHHVGTVEIGLAPQQVVEVGLGLVVVFELEMAEGAVVARALFIGHFAQRTGVVVHGAAVVLVVDAAEAAEFVDIDKEGIEVDALGAVGLGTEVVFECKLGVGAVIIGAGQVGLGLDGLVEIADSGEVVVHAERVAAHEGHGLGIDLCAARQGKEAKEQERQNPLSHTRSKPLCGAMDENVLGYWVTYHSRTMYKHSV